jgi:hypothetical protein
MPTPEPPAPADDARILRGLVEDLPVSDILQFLQVGSKSGALFLNRPSGDTAIVTLRAGNIVQAIRTDAYQTLGDRLIDHGWITPAQLAEGLAYMRGFPGMRIGDALVDRGFVERESLETEVRQQIAETIEGLMSWQDAQFEFRIGIASFGRAMAGASSDLVLADGVEPRQILLEATLLKDQHDDRPRASEESPSNWFGEESPSPGADSEDPEKLRVAHAYLTVTEELFSASERGEMALLLLRYASELYGDGGLLLKRGEELLLLGQFGSAFHWGSGAENGRQTIFGIDQNPLFRDVVNDARPYAGPATLDAQGGIASAAADAPGASASLVVPLTVLGHVSLLLFCRSPLSTTPDARALLALARQISLAMENLTLKEIARRRAPA